MAIRKQEFYEGAALHLLARGGQIQSLRYEPPLFVFNDRLSVMLKYSTKGRSPWGYTFTRDEQQLLYERAALSEIAIALVCGSDGVATFSYSAFRSVVASNNSPVHISCYRRHGKHYEVNGPEGALAKKVAPSSWLRILETRIG